MFEIKKIHAQSLANYLAIITAIIVFLFGLIEFILIMFGSGRFYGITWQNELISWFVSVLVFYIIAWIVGYLFSVIYNFLSSRGRGIIIDVDKVEMSIFKKKTTENSGDKKDNFVV